jgi:hypothetical protein
MTNVTVSNVFVRCLTDSLNCAGGHGAAPGPARFIHCAFETVYGNNCVYLLAKTGVFEECTFVGGEAAVYESAWWLGGGAHAELRNCVLSLTNTFLYLESNTSARIECSVYDTMRNGVGAGEGTWQTSRLEHVAFDLYSSNGLPWYADVYGRGWRRGPDAPWISAPGYVAPGGLGLVLTYDPVTVRVEKLTACDVWHNGTNQGQWAARNWALVLDPTGETNSFQVGDCDVMSVATRVIVDVPEPTAVAAVCAVLWATRRKKLGS